MHLSVALAFATAGLLAQAGLAQTVPAAPAPAAVQVAAPAPAPTCNYTSVESPPGKAWWGQQRWRYATDADAIAAYSAMVTGQAPFPNWFTGTQSMLPPGTRFQMAMSPGQPETSPGRFGTFDNIRTAEDVRQYLAVLVEWKPKIDRVVTFEVVHALPVQTGPVGPQVDPKLCALLPGRWSQFQVLPDKADFMWYLKVVEVRQIQ